MAYGLYAWFYNSFDTYTSPSGVYFEPEMSNWPRETWSPSTLSMMNICVEACLCIRSALIFSHRLRMYLCDLWVWTYLSYTHLVGGEGTGLVGADDWSAAQGLHRGQASDDGVLLGHTACSQSQAGGDDSGQTWDGRSKRLSRKVLNVTAERWTKH